MINLLSGLMVGFFTLAGIWLKDYLDNKNLAKSTIKEKAIEAYALTNKLNNSTTSRRVICENLIINKEYPYARIEEKYPDMTSEILENLELLIIENFYDLKEEFAVVNKIMVTQVSYLLNIMVDVNTPEFNLEISSFKANQEIFTTSIIKATTNLKENLIAKYINKLKKPIPMWIS